MSLNPRLGALIGRHGVGYRIVPHAETITTTQAARVTHVQPHRVAKVVVVRDSTGSDFLVVLPALLHFDPQVIHDVTGRPGVWLEDEAELRRLFPDCELGAMPPIGHLYGLATYIDPCLLESHQDIWFQGGNHHELVQMSVADFTRIATPFYEPACMHPMLTAVDR